MTPQSQDKTASTSYAHGSSVRSAGSIAGLLQPPNEEGTELLLGLPVPGSGDWAGGTQGWPTSLYRRLGFLIRGWPRDTWTSLLFQVKC